MIAFLFTTKEIPAQFDNIWKIQVVPFDLSVSDTREARIESAPDVNHNRIWMALQKIPRVAVEFPVAQDNHQFVRLAQMKQFDAAEIVEPVVADLLDHRLGLLVLDQCIRALRFHRPKIEREKQRFR